MATRATAIVLKENKLLMIHRHRDGLEYYVLPGGSVEDGEKPEEGVLRELEEETSIKAKLEKKLFSFVDREGREHQHFLCRYISGNPKLAEGSVEVIKTTANNTYDPVWMETDKIESLTIWPEQTKALLIPYLKIETAKEFAVKKFKEAGRGNHWPDVLVVLGDEFNITDPELLIAAILHDTLEDTETTHNELKEIFGQNVADLVQEVSHPKNYSGEQVLEFYEHLNHISPKAKILKLADFTANLRGITEMRKKESEKPYHDQYIVLIRRFLESCPDSPEKESVHQLTNELEKYVTEKYQF